MIDAAARFPHSYGEARDRFVAAARARGCEVSTRMHPSARGPDGGALSIDVAAEGDAGAPTVLIVSSGTHGVEGYGGSGIQAAWLGDDAARREVDSARVRIVLLHALNPWGFAHDARGDEDNVDLNRNFRDFARPQSANAGYAKLHPLLLPQHWPPTWVDDARLGWAIVRNGRRAVQEAVSRGQGEFADGLFYAGRAPSWSNRMLRALIGEHVAGRAAVGWVDLHTGLGRDGRCEVIFNGRNDARTLARARQWWGERVTSMNDGSSVSTDVSGANFAALDAAGIERSAGVTLEVGTRPRRAVLDALRARQWLRHQADTAPSLRDDILRQSRDAFYVDTDAWKNAAYGSARAILLQGAGALAREAGATR
ncbi:MAG: M14 family metallopeptidase [Betaproteobacteria bacterium]